MKCAQNIFLDKENISSTVERLQKQKKKVVLTNGAFDILHAGHIDFLQKAKALGDVLIVGVNSDESIKKYKDLKRPINPLYSRLLVLSALRCVDLVVAFSEERPAELIRAIKPDIYVKGGDYKKEQLRSTPLVESLGGLVVIIPFLKGYATTNIIDTIIDRYGKK